MHENTLPRGFILGKLANRFEKRQALYIPDRAAYFAEHEIHVVRPYMQEVFDFIGDVGDDLDGFAEVIAAPFLLQNGGVDAARGYRIALRGGYARESFVVAKV